MKHGFGMWDMFRFDNDEGAGGEGADERPDWLPENFKSAEDLAASYRELQTKLGSRDTETAAKIAELEARAQRADEYEAYYAQQQEASRRGDPREQFFEVWDDPDRQPELVLHLAERLANAERALEQMGQKGPDPATTQLTADYAEARVRQQYPDYDQYRDKISEVVQQNPRILGLTDNPTPQALAEVLGNVYWMVRGQSSATPEGQAAAQAAEAARLALEQAQTMSGQSSRPATQTPDEEYWARVVAANDGGYGS